MGDFKISGKNVITQAGTAEPVLASNVTLGTGIITPANIQDAATSTLSCTTNSTTTVTTADTSTLSVGMAVSGTGIPAGATIVTVPNATSFTLSAAATASATNTLTFQKGIVASKIEDDAVTSAKVADDAVTAAKIATGAVVADGLGADSVTATAIATGAVVADGLGAAAVTTTALHADVTAGGAISTAIKPHIQPGILCPAVAGKLLDGSTNHSGAYGTAQADGKKYYYTDIKGSGPIKDPRIGAHFGSQRHKTKSHQLLEQETATHGMNVYSIDGREWFRMVGGGGSGGILNLNRMDGHSLGPHSSLNAFFEIVGYFNDANVLGSNYTSARGWTTKIDGGSLSSEYTAHQTAIKSPLGSDSGGRYVDGAALANLDLPTTHSTTLGIHTLRIAPHSTSDYVLIYGIELIAQDTSNRNNIQIPSQNVVSYGKKFTVSDTPHYDPFNGFTNGTTLFSAKVDTATSLGLGTGTTWGAPWAISSSNHIRPFNGGRVVKWVDSSGTIKTSVTMMPRNAQNIGTTVSNEITTASATNSHTINFSDDAVDYSLSEVAKTFHWREFGNGGANQGSGDTSFNDASMLPGSSQDLAYVMDDGLTSLSADDMANDVDMLPQGNDDYWHITFIGTGVTRITKQHAQVTQTIAQNLPYGTHILKCARQNGGTGSVISLDGISISTIADGSYGELSEITFHQPKMPPIPEDAVVLADYMLMPDYVPQTAHTEGIISKGVRRVSASRDFHYNSTSGSSVANINVATHLGYSTIGPYVYLGNVSATATQELPYFGTSFCHRYHSLVNYVTVGGTTFTINGGNLSSYTLNAAGGGGTSITSAGVLTKINATDKDNFVSAVGGTLGLQKFKVSEGTSSGKYLYLGDLDVATPIHTSTHYQPFEDPFLKTLVGGDRNIEQNNLIVTADGKSWDEVTRDTSYTGAICVNTTTDTGTSWATWVVPDEWRGADQSGGANSGYYHNKDFAIAYDRLICLVDGEYEGWMKNEKSGSGSDMAIYVTQDGASKPFGVAGRDSTKGNIYIRRGDYVQFRGGVAGSGNWNKMQITRIK